MNAQDLMKPRWKVIADFPHSKYTIGQVFHSQELGFYDRYPAIFLPLKWHQERTIEEMPDYVKDGYQIFKVDGWVKFTDGDMGAIPEGHDYPIWQDDNEFLPSTEAEYLAYQSTLTPSQTS